MVCFMEHLNPSDGYWGQVPVTFPEMSAKAKLLHVVGTSHLWESRAESRLAGLLGGVESIYRLWIYNTVT